ncbi:leucyl aminopeptidase family protein [Brevundimonas sp.]|uniref:leucyl aminopeptidase family protein n=1 Tax=Brevundimonas sp. TaxID=1871086 RepID=UPI0025B82520|nr:leucyl aminopeptidase family protein [Brevundimonas sp.]
MATPSRLSAPEKTILVYGALGALLALALHAALLNRVWPWHNLFATLFAIQWIWLVPLAGAMLAGMRAGRRWLLALAAYGLVLPALHAYGLVALLGSQPLPYTDSGSRSLATLITAASGFMLLPLIQALDPSRPGWDYPAVFRAAWRNTVKLALAGGLALAVWLLFWAASAMFGMIGITAVGRVVKSTRFVLGVMPLVLAVCLVGVHRRPQLADTLQRSWLTLTAWLLPLVALVGKGVVFDTSGLDLKPAAGMRNMKKDMGGSAHALALGRLVMQADLPVRLVVIVAAVENAVSADAFRPGDILNSRKGLTIEIGNTDAEGRLILADALTRAGEHAPDLTLDFATLTGAARIALGPELPPLYTDDEALAAGLLAAAAEVRDPLWRMPLWAGYRAALDTEIADMKNDSSAWAQAGSVTAALFLQKFAPVTGAWAHMDIFAWNPRARPGYPEGAEAQALRACYAMLKARYTA